MRYLITGHTGFKGSWLAAILKSLGHEVVGISLPASENSLYNEARLASFFSEEYFLDIRNRKGLCEAIQSTNADVAFHLAAQPLVRESYKTPIETYETNVIGTLNFLEGITRADLRAAIVVTTDKVYKNKGLLRGYTELDELGGFDPYSSSKAAADIATQSWVMSYECQNIAIARAGNVVGGGDWATDRLIPDLVRAFSNGQTAYIRYPNSIRPWQHVADCLAGYIALSDSMIELGTSGAWNFGPEIDTDATVSRIAELAAQSWGEGASWMLDENPQVHEAGYLLLDSSKARDQLKWRDKLSLSQTLEWTMRFYKESSRGVDYRTLLIGQVEEFLSK
jgi:CDP-glucose 4,6-dehydratase